MDAPPGFEVEAVSAAAAWLHAQGSLLPCWVEDGERPEHQAAMFGFHIQQCKDFQSGFCEFHRSKGKASSCFCYHYDTQQRRAPVDALGARLLYWDAPCQSMSSGSRCPSGDECVFAHSKEEISYHPAKYKTRRCNIRNCRGESICCFAHNEKDLRPWAADRYSFWNCVAGQGASKQSVGVHWSMAVTAGAAATSSRVGGMLGQHKQRFCASFPDVAQCRRGAACAFAHSREEIVTPLLSVNEEQQAQDSMTEDFFMYKFKTLWCPIGVQHDWQTCVYAHNYQDARRKVSIGYGPRPCPYWAKKEAGTDYAQRCPLGLRCPYSHGAKEQLYHPQYFRTMACRDTRGGKKACPRQKLCAFWHGKQDKRKSRADGINYDMPLPEEALPESWVADFLSPPFGDNGDAAAPLGVNESMDEGQSAAELAELAALYRGPRDVTAASFWPYAAALGSCAPLEERHGEVTPRTRSGASEACDLSSASSREAERALANRARREEVAGVDLSPWKVPLKEPNYGPFGGPFDAFPGLHPALALP
jgi:hypothetical protein